MTEKEYLNKLTENENFFREEFADIFPEIEKYKRGEIDDIPYSYWNTKSNYRFNVNSKDKEKGEILAENEGEFGDGEIVMLCCCFNEDDKTMEAEDGRLYNAYFTYFEEEECSEYNIGSESLAPVPDWFVKYLCDADEIHHENVKKYDDYPVPGEN